MKTTKKWNKMFLMGMFGKAMVIAVLAFGMTLAGCSSLMDVLSGNALKADKGSEVKSTITLNSTDLASVASELGYTEKQPSTTVENLSIVLNRRPEYPAANVYEFTVTNKDGSKREGIKIESEVCTWHVGYIPADAPGGVTLTAKKVLPNGWVDIASYPTKSEADAMAVTARVQNPTLGITVNPKTEELLEYVALKPAQ